MMMILDKVVFAKVGPCPTIDQKRLLVDYYKSIEVPHWYTAFGAKEDEKKM